jgi:hypothetical protein
MQLEAAGSAPLECEHPVCLAPAPVVLLKLLRMLFPPHHNQQAALSQDREVQESLAPCMGGLHECMLGAGCMAGATLDVVADMVAAVADGQGHCRSTPSAASGVASVASCGPVGANLCRIACPCHEAGRTVLRCSMSFVVAVVPPLP